VDIKFIKEKLKKEAEEKTFRFFLFLSFILHTSLFLFILSSNQLNFFFIKNKKVVAPVSISVDMVGLPDFQKQEKKRKIKKKPVVLTKKSKKFVKSKTKKKDKFLEKNDKSKKKYSNKKSNKGNKLMKGSKKGQNTLNSEQISEINIYFTDVEKQIRSYWNLPKYLMDMDLVTQVEIRINNKGQITSQKIVGSSGNDLFDGQVLKAMEEASPYPSPPKSVQRVIQDGIVFTLHSRNR